MVISVIIVCELLIFHTGHTPKLGSTLMKTMLDEVNEFCHIGGRKEWAKSTQNQVSINKMILCTIISM